MIEEKILKALEREISEIKTFNEPKAGINGHEKILGDMNESERALWTLSRRYEQLGKQLMATLILIDDEEQENEAAGLSAEIMYYECIEDLLMKMMWAELRFRFRSELKLLGKQTIAIRRGFKVVYYTEPEMPSFIRGIIGKIT